MKKVFIVLLALVLVIFMSSAYAIPDDFDNFNVYAEVCGATVLDRSSGFTSDQYTMYNQDDCQITFKIEDGATKIIFVEGKGDAFLAYCAAALYVMNPSDDSTINNGRVLTAYFLAHNDKEQHPSVFGDNIIAFMQQNKDGDYTFGVGF
ncbi:MAG: hypothetical protein J6P40_07360 [Oscillospiraceae bacterium]|nr:hypothetical protein [Oscillospiraceae bacterium]